MTKLCFLSALSCVALVVAPSIAPAAACDGAQHVRSSAPVSFDEQQLAGFRTMPPLRIMVADAAPMTRYDPRSQTYTGVGVDVLCFITSRLGLRFDLIPGRDLTVADKIGQVQKGQADMFMPLSYQPDRANRGIFTLPYYDSYYAVIGRKGQRYSIRNITDLSSYRVGLVKGVSFEAILRRVAPGAELLTFDQTSSDGLFQAVRHGTVDVAVFNTDIFIEKRYQREYFDLEVIQTLIDYPRAYGFYFSRSARNEQVVQAFDRYLAVMDVSAAVADHQDGEARLIQRYVAQRSQRVLLIGGMVVAVLVLLGLSLMMRRYRRLARSLAASNAQILQQQQALKSTNQELERQSQTDGLTHLANRRLFDQTLVREHARHRRTGSLLSLLMMDIDHFKHVNDRYGHAVGDEYLCAVAQVLRGVLARSTDLAARYGGEEFAGLLPDTSPEEALKLAERIRQGVRDLNLSNASAPVPQLTISIGVATLMGGEVDAEEFLALADQQLYDAKRAGRDCVHATVIAR